MAAWGAVFVALLAVAGGACGLNVTEAGYHTTDDLIRELRELASTCNHMEFTELTRGATTLPRVHFDALGTPKHKVLLYFGEHARELISTEAALHMAKRLCSNSDEQAQKIRRTADIVMFPIINVDGRRLVESGQYCRRSNKNGVDLNRNWPFKWKDESNSQHARQIQSYGGPRALSEGETNILKSDADQQRPDIFLTIHSGTLGLYSPYAYDGKWPSSQAYPSTRKMRSILNSINRDMCNCDAGPAGKGVGYLCPGTCLDWMFATLKVPYAYGFEIYDQGSGYRRSPATSLLQLNEFSKLRRQRAEHSDFKQPESFTNSLIEEEVFDYAGAQEPFPSPKDNRAEGCFRSFNPATKPSYDATLQHWNKLLLTVVQQSMDARGN